MSQENIFLKSKECYTRNINPITHYIQQTALYISKMTGDNFNDCFDHIKTKIRTRQYKGMRDPKVIHYERNRFGDRDELDVPLSNYISNAVKSGLVLAPTFTCYGNPNLTKSLLSGFVQQNKKDRSKAKKEAQIAKAAGNTVRYIMKNNEQNNKKTYNNSLSGAFGTSSSILYNPTAHSTLTSTIRSVSSLGNASNERVIMGNRHYYSPDIVLFNLICCCREVDMEEISTIVEKYNLKYPTVDDVIDCIEYSAQFYWTDNNAMQNLRTYIEKMAPVERAAFLYVGDLYHIRKLNEGFIRTFLESVSQKITKDVDDPFAIISQVGEDIMNYVHQICFNDVRGLGKDYKKMQELGILNTLASTALNTYNVLNQYKDFIRAFFLTRMIPASHAYIPNMMRRSVVLSDTDSTCFSVDDWAIWYFGKFEVSEKAYGICGAVALIATQAVSHLLALLSANVGVSEDHLHSLAMKNEYLWPVHMPTNVAKHYGAWTVMQEGNVFKEPELEIKGVHLKNSAAPPELIEKAHAMITDILTTVNDNKPLSLMKYMREIADIEQEITASISSGDVKYFKRSKIKEAESYSKNEEESPYQHYTLWREVFQHKYGVIDPPPFGVIVIPVDLPNKTSLKTWTDSIEDKTLATNLISWLNKQNKTSMNTFYIAISYVQGYGIPEEIARITNVRKIVLDLTLVFRIILEALGFFVKKDWLVSDYFR